ncbi:MAG TPA: beta-ketoacyl synthase chain length factor [Bacteroidales bacterium]|nr:beta-ketoacyl synthase chain length factor [Bacteroidales bacterium]HPF04337.1 beta-ketoacyl synthase chain length factor [Bacteroidales bacterium]HPJ58385.1 beta-ketoacyl synthase chain length factor [Bacteroidales bacterium]HPR10809.1 beta-ketoacyl synthase chain length factor [Bacteroidales bacterium]HRW85992.1 beta-ketoacyl synthase chain length factor [Bacteroidales bacterium]
MKAYINGVSAVSPQNTFTGGILPDNPVAYSDVRFLRSTDPPWQEYLDPMASRRMSRIIKSGSCAALKALGNAGIKTPEAIITGTGFGCLEDTVRFLSTIYENDERLLNPTPFIQSTHNTVGASIALMLKCNGYNNTYGHRIFSFENALTDSMMLIREGDAGNVLLGGLDELTPEVFTITDRLGFWKKEKVESLNLREHKTPGTIAGEGSTFFVIGKEKGADCKAMITSVQTYFNPSGKGGMEKWISKFCEPTGCRPDALLLGINGDISTDHVYENIQKGIFKGVPAAYYKHLTGEYYTSAAFALALADGIIREQRIPAVMKLDDLQTGRINNLLIYNHFRNRSHALIMVSSC